MLSLVKELRKKHLYKEISDTDLQMIVIKCIDSIKKCYHRELSSITKPSDYDKKISEIVHTHCYNQTFTTKSQIKKIIKSILQPEIYAKFGVKLVYDIMSTGEQLTSEGSVILTEYNAMLNTNNPKLEIIGSKILVRLDERMKSKNRTTAMIDPITILIILSIVLTFIRILQECDMWNKINPRTKDERAHIMQEKIKNFSIKRSWLNRLRMNRVMKKYLTKEQYTFYGEELRESIMDVGAEATEEETIVLMEAANV